MVATYSATLLAPWTFRYRGRVRRILALVDSFLAEPNRGLAPARIARDAGLPLHEVAKLLNRTPELFIKLPGRGDGITRYRLASSVAARGGEEIEALVRRHAQRESWLLYGLVAMGGLLFLIVLLTLARALF